MAGVTVVLVCWGEYMRHLPGCVASLADDRDVADVLVVDNASTVPAPELPSWVAVHRLDQQLQRANARNAGLALAATELVCFLDADDELVPGTLRALTLLKRERPELVCAADAYGYWDGGGGTFRRGPWPPGWAYRVQHQARLLAVACAWRNAIPVTGPAVLRVSAARRAGGFSGGLHDDWAFAAALAWQGRICLRRHIGLKYRIHAGSVSRSAAVTARARAGARREVRA
ncbi:MAG: glycosyltransferase, partial [Solirubrobacterales bacterium]|nr:glycosyltransferase [Solirubrobacterales bacterium]